MIARGSLTYCIQCMFNAFTVQSYPMLSIIRSDSGHYYSVLTEEELHSISNPTDQPGNRLILRCTLRELNKLRTTPQTDIFLKEAPIADTNIDPS